MENLIYLIGGGILLLFVYKFAKQVLLKVLLFICFIGLTIFGLYYFAIGPFSGNFLHIDELFNKYCETPNSPTCQCIVKPLKQDMNERFTKAELSELKKDRLQTAYVFQKSLSEISKKSKACLAEKDQDQLWSQFIKENLHLDNAIVDEIESLFHEGKTSLDEKIEETKEAKENLDRKYTN